MTTQTAAAPTSTFEVLFKGFSGIPFTDQPRCPICGGTAELFCRPPLIDPEHPLPVDLLRCSQCEHGWINPLPTQELLSHLYSNASHSVIGVGWDSEVKRKLTYAERTVVQRESGSAPGEYFELGVGKGLLYQKFAGMGWKCCGVEPGAWGRFPGVLSSLEELPADAKFDVLVCLDVLEHVSNPVAVLRRLRQAARPGARLYCAFPNIQSFRARVQRARWRMARPFGHVHYYSAGSVRRMLADAGFAVTKMRRDDMWEFDHILSPRTYAFGMVNLLGLGDQWFVAGTPQR